MRALTEKQLIYCSERIGAKIKAFASSVDARGAVVAVSGGVDSALVLRLASSVVDVHALIMPEIDLTAELDTKDAEDLCDSFDVPYSIVPINNPLLAIKEAFPWVGFSEENREYAVSNVKPRLRMVFNYLLSNLDSRVVLGTGNKTELLLGYLTKYGDGGCDLEPIGGLYKTWVWQLARHLELPDSIVEKTPSAGLWAGQTDEEELGAPYGVIDDVLYLALERGYSAEKAASELGVDLGLVRGLLSRVERNRHKTCAPAVVQLDL